MVPQFIWNLGEPFAVRKIYRPSATEVEPHIYNPDWSQAKITCETKDNTQTHSNYLVNLSPKITVMMIIMPLVIILSLFEVNFPMFETKTILLLKHLCSCMHVFLLANQIYGHNNLNSSGNCREIWFTWSTSWWSAVIYGSMGVSWNQWPLKFMDFVRESTHFKHSLGVCGKNQKIFNIICCIVRLFREKT